MTQACYTAIFVFRVGFLLSHTLLVSFPKVAAARPILLMISASRLTFSATVEPRYVNLLASSTSWLLTRSEAGCREFCFITYVFSRLIVNPKSLQARAKLSNRI